MYYTQQLAARHSPQIKEGRPTASISWGGRVGEGELGRESRGGRVGEGELGRESWGGRVGEGELGRESWGGRVGEGE